MSDNINKVVDFNAMGTPGKKKNSAKSLKETDPDKKASFNKVAVAPAQDAESKGSKPIKSKLKKVKTTR